MLAELIDPLDCFEKDIVVEAIRAGRVRRSSLPDPDVEHKATDALDLVEHAVRECSQLAIPFHVGHRVEARPLLLPLSRMLARSFELEGEEMAFALEEPRPEATHLVYREDQSGKAEHRAIVVSRVLPAEVRTNVPEFVEVGEIRHSQAPDARKPAPERGPRKEGKAKGPCVSTVNVWVNAEQVNKNTKTLGSAVLAARPQARLGVSPAS